MHGSDITAGMRNTVRHLPPKEAAQVLNEAWNRTARRELRKALLLLLGLCLFVAALGYGAFLLNP